MIIEGKNSVRETIDSGRTINKLMVQNNLSDTASNEIIKKAKANGIRIDFVDKKVLDKKSETGRHQGFICDTVDFVYSDINDIMNIVEEKGQKTFLVILDGIEDPHNFGAIIRTCECAGVDAIIIPEHRSVMVNETVLKTSAGAVNNIKIAKVTNLNQTIEKLKQANVWVYGLEVGGELIYNTKLTGAIALVVGSEGKGISKLTKQNCDVIVSLPLEGKINSLNASVSCGVAVYEILRQNR